MIPVVPVPAERGDLHRPLRGPDRNRAVLQSRWDRPVFEERQCLLRQGVGGHVPVPRSPAQAQIPDAAAYAPGLTARRLQGFQHKFYILWYFRHGFSRPFGCISKLSVL